jgi:hypothetical protein
MKMQFEEFKFETNLAAEIKESFQKNWQILLMAIIMKTAATIFIEITNSRSQPLFEILLITVVAIHVHKPILEKHLDMKIEFTNSMMWSYGWRVAILLLFSLALTFFLASAFSGYSSGLRYLALLVIVAMSYALLLSIFGTMLPAVVAGSDGSLGAASDRTGKTFSYIFLRLFFIVGVPFAIWLSILLFVSVRFQLGEIISKNGSYSFLTGVTYLFGSVASFTATLFASVILSRAFVLSGIINGK